MWIRFEARKSAWIHSKFGKTKQNVIIKKKETEKATDSATQAAVQQRKICVSGSSDQTGGPSNVLTHMTHICTFLPEINK